MKEGYIQDFISGQEVKATPEEINATQVFSKILVEDYEYPISHIRTRPQYRVRSSPSASGKGYPVDIAVFKDENHTEDNLFLIVECKKPKRKDGRKQLETYMAMSHARFGVWYNGKERLCLEKSISNSGLSFVEIPSFPKFGENPDEKHLRRRKHLSPIHNLKAIFKDIRNYFAANSVGITRDEILAQQFINLLFCKIYDERFTAPDEIVRFRAEKDETEMETSERIHKIFTDVKREYHDLFTDTDNITLDPKSIRYAVSQLEPFCIKDAERDAIGDAFESFIGYATKGAQGQFFTPRNVVSLMVEMSAIDKDDKVIDPACGTGGFLIEVMGRQWNQIRKMAERLGWSETETTTTLKRTAENNLRGIDKDEFLAKTTKAYMVLMDDGRGGIFCENSLRDPAEWHHAAKTAIVDGTFDVVLTNPPFGHKLSIDDSEILSRYTLVKHKKGELMEQAPQILFLEKSVQLLNRNGRLCIVMPESIICNPSHKPAMEYLQNNMQITAIISMPEDLFQPYTHAKTCVILAEKKPRDMGQKIFMAIARNCGHDSRGNKTVKDDIPEIARRFRDFKAGINTSDHLGFVIKESEIKNRIYLPKYYNPEIEQDLDSLKATHDLITVKDLLDNGMLQIKTGNEVKKESYGSGRIPFIRTSDIANWEIKLDPKQGLSEDIYRTFSEKQDIKPDDILMVRDGTYLVGTTAIVTASTSRFIYQSHIYKIRSLNKDVIHPYLLLAILSSPIVKRQIYAKRFTQDIIDTLGERIRELILPIPKDERKRNDIIMTVSKIIELKETAKNLSKKAILNIAKLPNDSEEDEFMTITGM